MGGSGSPNSKMQNGFNVDRLVTFQVAFQMLPFPTENALYQWLFHHKEEFPPRYTRTGRWKEPRMLYESEIQRIQEMKLIDFDETKYARRWGKHRDGLKKAPKRAPGPLGRIAALAATR